MNNTYATLIGLLVRAFFLWFMGALASHLSPSIYTLVNDTIAKLGGQEALITSIAGTVGLVILAAWLKLKSKLHLDIALDLPKGSNTDDVKNVAEDRSVLTTLSHPGPQK